MTVRGYLLGVDWLAVGDPAGTGEDDTSDALDDDITVSWGRDTTQAASQPPAGKFSFGLDNTDGRYSPQNVSSPLFGNVLPGRRVVLQHTDPTAGDTISLFDGILANPRTEPGPPPQFHADDCEDAWGHPSAESLSTQIYSGIRTGDAVNIVLDAIGWEGRRIIDPGVTCMPWWWVEGDDAATAIGKLVDSEGPPAMAYVRAGVFVFEDRHHRTLNAASTISAGLFTNIGPGQVKPAGAFRMLKGSISYDHGLARIVNSVTFTIDERRIGEPVEVWSTETPFWIDAGATVTFFVTASDPFVNAVPPLEGAGINSDTGIVVASLSRTSGASTILSVTAAAGTLVTRLALTAQPVAVASSIKVQAEDAGSVGRFGRNTWPKDAPFANRYDAQAIADRVVTTYAANRPVITFEVSNSDPATFDQIRHRQISDRITIRDDTLGVNDDYMIEAVQHTIRKWNQHRVMFTCEVPQPTQPENVFTFNVAGKGFNQGLFGATGIDTAANVFMFDPPDQNVMPFGGGVHPDTSALWSKSGATFVVATSGTFGDQAFVLTVVGTPTQAFARTPDSLPIIGGDLYRIAMIASASNGPAVPNVRVSVDWFDSGGVYISTGQSIPDVTVPLGGFPVTVASGSLLAPSNAATGRMGPTIGASPAAGVTIYCYGFTFDRVANGFDTGVFGT